MICAIIATVVINLIMTAIECISKDLPKRKEEEREMVFVKLTEP